MYVCISADSAEPARKAELALAEGAADRRGVRCARYASLLTHSVLCLLADTLCLMSPC